MYATQNTASVTVTPAPVDEAKKFLLKRLDSIRWEKGCLLQDHFQTNGIRPKSVKEFKEWLKSGNYRVEDPKSEDENEEEYFCWYDHFKWGKTEPDFKAYYKAKDELDKAYQDTVDTIQVITDEEKRLKVLKDFESATFH